MLSLSLFLALCCVVAVRSIDTGTKMYNSTQDASKTARLHSHFRTFVKQRIERRKGGGNDATSKRGLFSLGFSDHRLPHRKFTGLLQKVLLSDLPVAYHTREGVNALHVACAHGNIKVVEKLIDSGAVSTRPIKPRRRAHKINPRKRTKSGMSVLHFTAVSESDAVNICSIMLDLMLQSSQSPQEQDTAGLPADVPPCLSSKERLIVELLLQNANPVNLNVLGLCVLSSGKTDTLRYLLSQLPSPGMFSYILSKNVTQRQQTLVHLACYNSDYDTLMLMKENGLSICVMATDMDGRTPLHHLAMSWRASASERHRAIYDVLKHEYLHQHQNQNQNQNEDQKQLIPFLERKSTAGETALHLACSSGAVELARMLWKDGASLDIRDCHGNTPMVLLLRHRYKAVAQLSLLEDILKSIGRHSWFDSSIDRNSGQTALVKACEWRNPSGLEILLRHLPTAACVGFVDINGKTAVHYCAETSFNAGLKSLLDVHLKFSTENSKKMMPPPNNVLEMQDSEGCTPLMLAIGSNDPVAVRIILGAVMALDAKKLEKEKGLPTMNILEDDVKQNPSVEDLTGIETASAATAATPFPSLAKQLIEYQNKDGLSPLQCSALLPDAVVIRILLDASVSCQVSQYVVSSMTKEENNILHCSAAGGSSDTAMALAEFDLQMAKYLACQRNKKGKTPSDLAGYWKQHDVRQLLLNLEHDK